MTGNAIGIPQPSIDRSPTEHALTPKRLLHKGAAGVSVPLRVSWVSRMPRPGMAPGEATPYEHADRVVATRFSTGG
jgi:hypothetical protein